MRIKQKGNNRKIYFFSFVLAILVVLAVVLYLIRDRSITNVNPVPTSSTSDDASKPSGTISASKDAPNDKTPVATPPSNITPQVPVGTFVSNHYPNLSNSPAPNTMNSTCTTTSGVACRISFTKGDSTLYLPDKQTDANGNASWYWKLQDISLTAGSWTVTAVATNGDKSSSSIDPMILEVKP